MMIAAQTRSNQRGGVTPPRRLKRPPNLQPTFLVRYFKITPGTCCPPEEGLPAEEVESRMGAVAWGLWPAPRFPSPLIEPDVRISRIRLSDWLHRWAHDGRPLHADVARRHRGT
jgi:hypothetical protein